MDIQFSSTHLCPLLPFKNNNKKPCFLKKIIKKSGETCSSDRKK